MLTFFIKRFLEWCLTGPIYSFTFNLYISNLLKVDCNKMVQLHTVNITILLRHSNMLIKINWKYFIIKLKWIINYKYIIKIMKEKDVYERKRQKYKIRLKVAPQNWKLKIESWKLKHASNFFEYTFFYKKTFCKKMSLKIPKILRKS